MTSVTELSKRDVAARWALEQVAGSVMDPTGFLTGIEVEALKDSAGAESRTMIIDTGGSDRPSSVRTLVREAIDGSMRVIVIDVSPDRDGIKVGQVMGWCSTEVEPIAFVYSDEWWGMTLVPSDSSTSAWNGVVREIESRLGLTAGEARTLRKENGQLKLSRNRALDELDVASRELGFAVNENGQILQRLAESQRNEEVIQQELEAVRSRVEELEEVAKRNRMDLRDSRKREASAVSRVEELEEVAKRNRMDLRDSRKREASALDRSRQLQRRVEKLTQDRSTLRTRLAVERWKIRSIRNRRWWRLGSLLASIARQPLHFKTNARLVRELLSPPPMPGRPESVEGDATGTTDETTHPPTETPPVRLRNAYTQGATTRPDFRPAPQPKSLSDLRVAAVLDDMSAACFAPDCELVTFTLDDWRDKLTAKPPHLLLVESAWRGNGGSWQYQIGSYAYPDSVGLPALSELVAWCRQREITTVFWNKEDPVHFEKFKEAAGMFDVVFTTDADQIPAYRELLPRESTRVVEALPFAAQPGIHFPGSLTGRQPRPAFAGTFYRNRHPERMKQMEMLLDAAVAHDLVIYDRMEGKVSESFGYPDRFHEYILGGVPYEQMVDVYRHYRVFLNVNSVVESPTMMSRRVFELLACGTPVVSTPSRGLSEIFENVVTVVETHEEASRAIERLTNDDRHWAKLSLTGLTAVAGSHLYEDRLAAIASAAGFPLVSKSTSHSDWRIHADPTSDQAEELMTVGRIMDCAAIAYTDDLGEMYTYVDLLPEGPAVVDRKVLDRGIELEVGADLGRLGRVFLLPR